MYYNKKRNKVIQKSVVVISDHKRLEVMRMEMLLLIYLHILYFCILMIIPITVTLIIVMRLFLSK